MSKISRADIYTASEKGGDWFEEFLRICKDQNQLFDKIIDKKSEGVADIVKQYREAVGLDLIKNASGLGPIAPMKLKKITKAEDILKNYKESDLIVQQKFDGWKTQAIKADGKVKLYSRRGEAFEENVPDLTKELEKQLKDGDIVLGEITYVKDGKQNISDLQTIVGSNKEKSFEFQKDNSGKVILQAYDLLWDTGKDITKDKYTDRYNKLKDRVKQGELIKVPKNYTWSQKDKAISDALKAGGEGIVIKPKDSEYKYSSKGETEPIGEWAKFKPGNKAKEEDVIVKEYTKGKDKLIFPAYQYKGNELVEVSKISGLPKEDEQKVKNLIDKGKMVVLEVGFQEKYEDTGKLRHPGFHRIRPDKSPKEVKMKTAIRKISIRQVENIIDVLNNNPELKEIIDSFCINSGGTKNTHSIINYLRKKLGNNLVRFSDKDLIKYIEERKENFKDHHSNDFAAHDVGRVGIDVEENYGDQVADYYSHGK